jgi:hypothetical protein
VQPLGQRYHPPKAIMVEALTSWAAHEQDEAGASFARHRENVCALGLGKNMEIEELTKKVKALEAFSAAEEKRGIDLRERTRKCGQMILATGEVVALPRRAGEAVGLAERVSAWRAKLESGQMGVLILQQAMLRDLFRQCPDEEEAINDAIRRYEEDLRGRFGPILVDQVEDIAESLREVDARERLPVRKSKFYGAFVLNHRVVLHAIDATPARWRGDAGSSPLAGASAATSSPRNDLVTNCRVHPTHWLISTQTLGRLRGKMERSCPDGGVRSVEIHVGPSRRRGARPRPRWRAADAARVATGGV